MLFSAVYSQSRVIEQLKTSSRANWELSHMNQTKSGLDIMSGQLEEIENWFQMGSI